MQHRWKAQTVVLVAVGLVLFAAAVVALILLNRPEVRAFKNAVLVYAGVAAL